MLYDYDHQWYRNAETPAAYVASDKGLYNGSCNRSDCQAPHSATWWNQSTQKYYCFACADLINEGVSIEELRKLGYSSAGLCVPEYDDKHPYCETLLVSNTTQSRVTRAYLELQSLLCEPKTCKDVVDAIRTGSRSRLSMVLSQRSTMIQSSLKDSDIDDWVKKIMPDEYCNLFPVTAVQEGDDVVSVLQHLLTANHGMEIPYGTLGVLKITNYIVNHPDKFVVKNKERFIRTGGIEQFLPAVLRVMKSLSKSEAKQKHARRHLVSILNEYSSSTSLEGL